MKATFFLILLVLSTLVIGCQAGPGGEDIQEGDEMSAEEIDQAVDEVVIEEDFVEIGDMV